MADYRTILAATDLSDRAVSAVRHAAALAARLESELVVAYVVDDRLSPMILAASGQSPEEILERHREHAAKSLTEFVKHHLSESKAREVVLSGSPHEAILRYAKEEDIDLIVVGTHGHGLVGHVLMGSTAERILHQAPCPVLVVRS